jgi:hypothetical protein
MLRHLGQRLERDPQLTHPRVGEVDPADSVFVVYLYPEREATDPTPHIGSIWLSLSEANVAAERYVKESHPMFASGRCALVSVVEYETQKMQPSSQRHGDPLIPPAPPPAVNPHETPEQRLHRIEAEAAEIRIQLRIGTQTTIAAPETR